MSERLDHLLHSLAAQAPDRSLHDLERRVMAGVTRVEAERRTSAVLAPVRFAAVGLAMLIGATAGGLAAAATLSGPTAFQAAHDLAPSTLLADGR